MGQIDRGEGIQAEPMTALGARPKVRLLLDVDGVLNALSSFEDPGELRTDRRIDVVDGFHIVWSPSVVDVFRVLHERGVDVQWLTTWGEAAKGQLSTTMQLPQFPVLGERGYHETDTWWKLVLVQAAYALDRVPFVWIDDEIDYDPETTEWLETLPPDQFLAVTPDSMTGLDADDIDTVTAFIDRWVD
jgi:hypothetical protein